MEGTHKRMLEALSKNIPIYYICPTYQVADHLAHTASKLYGLERKRSHSRTTAVYPPSQQTVTFMPLSDSTYPKLLGFRGCVLMHPHTFLNLHNPNGEYHNLQNLIIQCNSRTSPWQP